jgi:hypothetical protein|tara:strand:- start:853 stop:1365 length:513 start_codon:yes stop_codon:yes gene_type:complete
MTVTAKTLVKDKFWILEQGGKKLGTLQKKENNGWIFLSKSDNKQIYHTKESLFEKFGIDLFAEPLTVSIAEEQPESINFEVHGYPSSQKPFNPMFDVQKQLPIYSKTPKSKSLFCAGYYIICFEKGWRKAYCPKLITLQRYPYKGPMKTKIEMQQVLNNAVKEQNTNTPN